MQASENPAKRCPIDFPAGRDDPYAPPPAYRPDGRNGPPMKVAPSFGGESWLVTRHRDIRTLLSDESGLSADATRDGYPAAPLSHQEAPAGVFIASDPPEHTRLRRFLNREFGATAVGARRPRIAAHVDRLLTAFIDRGPGGDLVTDFCDPLPRHVAADLFGVPDHEDGFVRQCGRLRATQGGSAARRVAAGQRMRRMLDDLIGTKLAEPTDDLLGRLVSGPLRRGELERAEVVGMATLLLAASLDTTASLIGLTTLSLLRDQEQGRLVRHDPERWAGPAVAEALRYWTVVQHGPVRAVTADLTLGGQRIRAGESVILQLHSANWDDEVYDQPELFDLRRAGAPHLAFGHGIHRCLGAGLGQLEARIAVAALFTRLPEVRLAVPAEELRFHSAEHLFHGVHSLPVAW